jgi:hypothetical protein
MRLGVVLAVLMLATPAAAQEAITAWCAGGVTGGGTATRIDPDGSVTALRRPTATSGEIATPLGSDPAAFRRFTEALASAGFPRLPREAPGNMTCGLTQGATRLTWAGTAAPAALPPAVAEVFTALRAWRPQ